MLNHSGFSGEMNELEEINKIHGTDFKIGDTIKQDRSPKRSHIGMLAATEDGHLKMIHDGDSHIYAALYNPSWVKKLSA